MTGAPVPDPDAMPVASTRVLVVEDDRNISDLIMTNLSVRGFDVVVSPDGRDIERIVDREDPDIVLLDLTLPHQDGLELCQLIRARSEVGIIVISARRGEPDKVRALNQGADDYMTKPFGINELLARIAATLRRTRTDGKSEPTAHRIEVGNVLIDLAARSVTVDGQPIHLTPTEFSFLRELAVDQGKVLTHAMLLRRVWGPGYETETEYTRAYVRRLRAKLENPGCENLIVTAPRVGYRLAGA